jgi:hypothetical protein
MTNRLKNKIHFSSIQCTDRVDIHSCAQVFLVDVLGLLCSATQCSPENAQMKAGDVSASTLNHHYSTGYKVYELF